jgi:hypothetical protein
MAYYNALDPGSKNQWRGKLSQAGKRTAASLTCRSCGRGNAMGRAVHWLGGFGRKCRYCGHEHIVSV